MRDRQMGMSSHDSLEADLCRLLGRSHCILVSSATAGIALSLKAAGVGGKRVAVPAGVCANVPLAILFSGNAPAYLDCETETLGLAPEGLENMPVDSLGGVVAVHCYGNPCRIGDIAEHCRRRGIPLIEDAAAALGATVNGRPVGSFGDVSVISFGAGKTIDVGGGGAVLTDDPTLAKDIRLLREGLPAADGRLAEGIEELSRWHTRLYNQHYGRDLNRHAGEFLKRAMDLRHGFLCRGDGAFADDVRQALGKLATLVANRRGRWEVLLERFQRLDLADAVPHRGVEGHAPWRFNLLFRSRRDAVMRRLLGLGIKVSSWFPPADLYLCPGRGDGDGDTPVASRIGREILNLWVNEEIGDDYVERVGDEIAAS